MNFIVFGFWTAVYHVDIYFIALDGGEWSDDEYILCDISTTLAFWPCWTQQNAGPFFLKETVCFSLNFLHERNSCGCFLLKRWASDLISLRCIVVRNGSKLFQTHSLSFFGKFSLFGFFAFWICAILISAFFILIKFQFSAFFKSMCAKKCGFLCD